jgi:hypothetical protein
MVSTLFYHSYIEDVLRELDEADTDQITRDFVIEKAEKAARIAEQDTEKAVQDVKIQAAKELEEKEREFLGSLSAEKSRIQEEKEEERLDAMRQICKKARLGAEKAAATQTLIVRAGVVLALAIPLLFFLVRADWDAFRNAAGIASAVVSMVAVGLGFAENIWEKLERWRSHKLYAGRINELGLEEFS